MFAIHLRFLLSKGIIFFIFIDDKYYIFLVLIKIKYFVFHKFKKFIKLKLNYILIIEFISFIVIIVINMSCTHSLFIITNIRLFNKNLEPLLHKATTLLNTITILFIRLLVASSIEVIISNAYDWMLLKLWCFYIIDFSLKFS